MQRHQLQRQPGDPEKQYGPHHEAPDPAQPQEKKERRAQEACRLPGPGQHALAGDNASLPSLTGDIEGVVGGDTRPDQGGGQDDQLHGRGSRTAVCLREQALEHRQIRVGNDPRLAKVLRQGDEAPVSVTLRRNHDPNRDQVPRMNRPIREESPTRVTIVHNRLRYRRQRRRQPRQQGQGESAAPCGKLVRPGQPKAAQQTVKRAAHHQREPTFEGTGLGIHRTRHPAPGSRKPHSGPSSSPLPPRIGLKCR